MDARTFTVGPFMENSYLVRRDGSDRALFIDPGDEAPKLLGALEALGLTLDAILLTHTHIDHVGAVAPVATATGAEVWVPEVEKPVLADINRWVPWPDLGPFESWDAEHTLAETPTVYPGHMGITTLGAERASNPFLVELAR